MPISLKRNYAKSFRVLPRRITLMQALLAYMPFMFVSLGRHSGEKLSIMQVILTKV